MKTALSLLCAAVVVSAGPIVDLGAGGKYEGFIDEAHNVSTFLGIRYAAPPTGALRWQAPTAPAFVQAIQQATTQPSMCYQGAIGINATADPLLVRRDTIAQSEDCLFLNNKCTFAFSNAEEAASDTRLDSRRRQFTSLAASYATHAVSGYFEGAASQYNGTDLVVESNRNAVVVVMQYRLGLFGFLAGQEIHDHGVANAGLLDQQFALRWVHQNIAKFGGDPAHVTIWGESAGAGSVFQHLVANRGKTQPQLFTAAITSSSYAALQYPYNHWAPQGVFNNVSALAGCAASTNLDCLRAVDADTLGSINLALGLEAFFGTLAFAPVVDGSFIVESPLIQLAKGEVNGEYYLGVGNTNEAVIFVDAEEPYEVEQWIADAMPAFTAVQREEIARVYAQLGGTALEQIYTLLTETAFLCPTQYLLDVFPNKSYRGQFAIPPALHGQDVPYYFPSFVADLGVPIPFYNNTDFLKAFQTGFLSFAVNYNPNEKLTETITPEWPLWSVEKRELMVFNQTQGVNPQPAVGLQTLGADVLARCE
ncbi:Carboxylic ester hydrolase [Mycena chlorophos]|uniref:Carboxylic ester hydrolase n=1 Tax=Mycena chlorophos TaxID=658473 RepID=A0A8H6VX12_MYCCL|nr:Carboxylic ester hydrolase [Mycena chlorophos]